MVYNNLMFVAGLTGNYGMGKSAVLSMFRKLGAITIDADRVVKHLLRGKETLDKIKALLGTGVFDAKGKIEKKKVAERVFKDKNLRIKLEDILHPLVFEKINNFIKGAKNAGKVFIVEAPLIYERGYEDRFDRIIAVFTDESIAIKRLGMHGTTSNMARQRLRCQLPIEMKLKRADFKIDNSGTMEETRAQAEAIYKKLSEEARVKNLILQGKVHEAAMLLRRPYYIEGKVIKGAGRGGKLLHTPTANISFTKGTAPKEGVYAVRVIFNRKEYDGVSNIGENPTFGASSVSYEVHIFNFSGNLLGKKLRVHFIKRLRDEKKFPNIKALEAQIKKDIKKAKDILKRETAVLLGFPKSSSGVNSNTYL